MTNECIQGTENKTNIANLSEDLKDIKDKELPNIRKCLAGKVSAVFVGVGIFVLTCLLGVIYSGQRDISKDITLIKIEQSKVTSIYNLQEKRIDKLEQDVEIRTEKVERA